jgi:hypothetical protein
MLGIDGAAHRPTLAGRRVMASPLFFRATAPPARRDFLHGAAKRQGHQCSGCGSIVVISRLPSQTSTGCSLAKSLAHSVAASSSRQLSRSTRRVPNNPNTDLLRATAPECCFLYRVAVYSLTQSRTCRLMHDSSGLVARARANAPRSGASVIPG